MQDPLYFEDMAVGQTYRSGPTTLDRDGIVAFARQYDPQPQHLSEDEARGSVFGTLVASGWQTAATTMRLQLEALMHRFPGGALGAQVDRLAWRRPVHPGDTLHVVVEVVALRPSQSRPQQGLVTLQTRTVNQDGAVVQEMTAAVLIPRRSPG